MENIIIIQIGENEYTEVTTSTKALLDKYETYKHPLFKNDFGAFIGILLMIAMFYCILHYVFND